MNWILRSYWSDQKYGTDEKLVDASGPASAFSAACTACSTALVQCSIRGESPCHRFATRATSPAAYTSGAASPEPLQTMPLSSVRPLRFEPFRVWSDADADHHHVGVDP